MTRLLEAKPFIIAEVGSNWRDYNDCKEAIDMAHACGADAVKFQLFDGEALYDHAFREEKTLKGELPKDWIPKLAERCKVRGIEFMCSAFSVDLIKLVDPYVNIHKVASSEMTDPDILETIKATGKPIIISCGGSSRGDINIMLNGHKGNGRKEISWWRGFEDYKAPVVLLYCNSAYPSKEHNLFAMEELKRFGRPVGYSDHSLDVVYSPLSAVKHFGAIVIEKHFNNLPAGVETPDSPHSLDSRGFKLMADYLRGKRESVLNPTSEEAHMMLRNNRRLIATLDMKPGTVLVKGQNFGSYRTLEDDPTGMSPFFWEMLEGKTLKVGVSAGKGLSISMVE